jgi:hypothetical protein
MDAKGLWPDPGTLAAVASVIAAFSIAMIFWRVQRELQMSQNGEVNWIPRSDFMLISAAGISLILILLPLVSLSPSSWMYRVVPPAACAGAVVLVTGYPFALLAHYRLILGGRRVGPRSNPEPSERWIVPITWGAAIAAVIWTCWLHD